MPIYQYKCEQCGNRFELLRGVDQDDSELTCPKCSAKSPRRVISSFSTFTSGSGCAPIGGG